MKIFKMLKTFYSEYKELKDNQNNNVNPNNIILSNQLEKFDLNEKLSNEKLLTNINEIIPNINNTSIPFFLHYPINFKQFGKEYRCIKTLSGHSDKIVSYKAKTEQLYNIFDMRNSNYNYCINKIKEEILLFTESMINI